MYISQLLIDSMSRRGSNALADPYFMHQLVMSGFKSSSMPSRVLFRVETGGADTMVRVLVQSLEKPEWETSNWVSVQTKEFKPRFTTGSRFRFRLRANPIVTRGGKRKGLVRDDAIAGWLERKSTDIGAAFHGIYVVDEGYMTSEKKPLKIKTARLDGVLEVTDPEKFENAFFSGIGAAKGFGCGMLSLARR